MAPPAKLLALDVNILIDLADGKDFAHSFREEFQSRGYSLIVPPTAIVELTLLSGGEDLVKAKLALTALQSLREWGLQPYDLKSVGHGITAEFSRRLIARGLLPEDEFNDGIILAETALAAIPALVTSDRHLLNILPEALQIELNAAEMPIVTVAHPRALLRALY